MKLFKQSGTAIVCYLFVIIIKCKYYVATSVLTITFFQLDEFFVSKSDFIKSNFKLNTCSKRGICTHQHYILILLLFTDISTVS